MGQYGSRKATIDNYTIIELFNEDHSISIAVDLGNNLYHWSWKNKEIIWFPNYLEQYQNSKNLAGIPFMYPWANRLGSDAFFFEGQEYPLENSPLIKKDSNDLPIHGLLLKTDKWQIKDHGADDNSAWYISEYIVDENSEIFALYPFLHTLEMTYRLKEDGVAVRIKITNQDTKKLPISFGFHPYFSLEQYNREQVVVHIPCADRVVTDTRLLPTGQLEPAGQLIPNSPFPLKKFYLDDGFVNRTANENPYIETEDFRLEMVVDETFDCLVVYSPYDAAKKFICIEPMIVPTNSLQNEISSFPVPSIAPQSSEIFSFEMKISERR